MFRSAVALAGLALLGVSANAHAQEKVDPLTQAMLACGAVKTDDARLRCYDQTMSTLKNAIDQGEVILDEDRGPIAREGIIKASGQTGESSFWIELESGERWNLMPTTPRRHPPKPGGNIKVRKSFFSGYWVSAPDWPETRARFKGRGS